MVTVGKTSDGRPICKPLKPESYFATYNDAYAALVEYNKNPYDLGTAITMQELYDKWLPEYEKTVKSTKAVTSAWPYCSAVYKMRVMDIRARHVKGCMEEGVATVRGREQHPTATMKNQIKSMFNMMLDYALEYELVDRNYSRTFNLTEETVKEIQKVKRGILLLQMMKWNCSGIISMRNTASIFCSSSATPAGALRNWGYWN